ncbi:Glycosyl hydrolases family 43 [Pustulibacterium marinum]|uniref:Glycosyl hydrolases family 43 n=1 Tax=Pustulibacterium marinum TaxID=1224947 RepID=A0A1I7GDF2_9FLAO|nr:glycoside hydrolase family 43 protein [Pustulibacterium marinum]SFU46474.1 Glycosyl hydrolases family 43 [Pustulibacterium marinum]
MKTQKIRFITLLLAAFISCKESPKKENVVSKDMPIEKGENPISNHWYADPEGIVFGNEYWIYPTYSAKFDEQVYFDAFSSKDLVHWTKHERILDTSKVAWAIRAMWAPAVIKNKDQYFFFFGANDIQREGSVFWDENDTKNHSGGIGIAVADNPGGPFKDYLGKPLIGEFYNDAQPIDQFVYQDDDGQFYIFYGGWGHCNIGKLSSDFTSIIPWEDGQKFHEITPESYVEGPFLFKRNNTYYFMWSEGNWGDDSYKVAYAMADEITGPFKKVGTILESDKEIATGAGHNSVIHKPNSEDYYMVYHRRPIPNKDRDHRVTCIDRLYFNEDGTIKPVKMTFEGVESNPIP